MEVVDVVIPTYKPDQKFLDLMKMLSLQTIKINRIIIMNTEEKYYEQLLYGKKFLEQHRNTVVYHCSKREFDHGNTRNHGVKHSQADIFIMMTQDCVPKDEYVVEHLCNALKQDHVAVSYARQVPNQNANKIEQFTRNFNYPDQSRIKTGADISELGIKTYFCSNVCAAYRRDVFDQLGGFIQHTIFNEDMIFAGKAVQAGYGIAYVAEAVVTHSHSYRNREQFRRNFDLGVSQVDNPEVFQDLPSESEGMKLVKLTAKYLVEQKQKRLLPQLFFASASKYMGFRTGKRYKKLSKKTILKYTMNPAYWEKTQLKQDRALIDEKKGYGKNTEVEGE